MGWSGLRFRPHKKGFEKILGELEVQVMEVVWRRGEVSVRDVFEELDNKRSIAYTTVLSTMSNLHRKGFLHRTKSGVAFLYTPAYSRDELARLAVDEVVTGLMDGFGQHFLACLADLHQPKELVETVARLEKQLAERKKGEQ